MDYFNSKYTLYQWAYTGNHQPADHFYRLMVAGLTSPELRVDALDLILKPEEVNKHHYQPAAYLWLPCSATSRICEKVKYGRLDGAMAEGCTTLRELAVDHAYSSYEQPRHSSQHLECRGDMISSCARTSLSQMMAWRQSEILRSKKD